jgi:uncharacterized membrane protein
MAALHPQIVHFTIVLAIVGVAFRIVSLFGRPAFAGPARRRCSFPRRLVVSVRSGTAAHGPVSALRRASCRHGARGVGERNAIMLLTLGIELLGLRSGSPKKLVRLAAAVVGVAAVFSVYETAEHGGDLVTRA